MERRSKDGVIYERAENGWRVVGYEDAPAQAAPRPMTFGTPDPSAQYAAPKAAADLQGAQVRTQTDMAQLPYAAPTAAANASKAQTDAEAAALNLQKARNEAGNVPDPRVAKALKTLGNDELLSAISKANGEVSGWSTGLPGQMLKNLWGTDAADLAGSLNTVGSASMLAKLSELKAASPTGASGLGALSEREGAMLRDSIAAIGQDQSPEKLRASLAAAELHYRRSMALADGQNPDDPAIAQRYGIASAEQMDRSNAPPSDGPSRPQMGLSAEGDYKDVPGVKGANARVAAMIAGGRPEAEIRAYLDTVQPGLGKSVQQLPEAIAWARQNPGKSVGVDVERQWQPSSGFSRTMGETGMSPLGAGVIGAADMLTMGGLDNLTGDSGKARAVMSGVQALNPNAYLMGQVAGGVGSGLGIEAGLGRAGMAGAAQMRAGDALLGGLYGAGSADEPGDSRVAQALLGAGAGLGGGMAGRGVARTAGRLTAGVRDDAQRLLNERGVPQTLGQILGGAAKTTEDRLSGLPLMGDVINPRRMEGLEGFNRAAFDESLGPIKANTGGQIGQAGINASQDATGAAYRKALGGSQVMPDQAFGDDLAAAVANIRRIPRVGNEVTDTVGTILDPAPPTGAASYFDPVSGALSGENMQPLMQELGGVRRAYQMDPLGNRVGQGVSGVEDAVTGMFERQAPDVMPDYNAANEAYRNSSVIEDAVLAALNNPRSPGTFTPAQLGQASRANTKRFGGKRAAARGDMPFNELQQAGQQVLPSLIPDSGTAGRAVIPAVAAALAGGGGAAASDGDATGRAGVGLGTGAIAAALVSAPYSAGGRAVLQKTLLTERPDALVRVGDMLINRSRIAGLLAAPAAVEGAQ
jgi:hypothetical protein